MTRWQLQEAKAKFSKVVRKAQEQGPQLITMRGKPTAVVIDFETYFKSTTPKHTFIEFIRKSPLAKVKLKIERLHSPPRDVKL